MKSLLVRRPKYKYHRFCRMDRFLYRNHSFKEKILLFPLYLASFPYEWLVRIRSSLYSLGFFRQKRLPCPVISIGNITVGGTGKTPLVMAIAKTLKEKGIPVAILSRGYKRKKDLGSLVSDGTMILLKPEEAGDEGFLMAERLEEIPILVGKDRFINGLLALQRFELRGFILDDGFQHLPLYRDLNIVLIDSIIGFGNGSLLPWGILREPLSHLHRADLFVLTKVKDLKDCLSLESKLQNINARAKIFHSHYEPVHFVGLHGEIEDLSSMKGKKVFAFSGIAHPEAFFSLLEKVGVDLQGEKIFPDHYFYTPLDLERIRREAEGVEVVVTTEKDLMKLRTISFYSIPLKALRIEVKIWEEEEFYRRVMEIF
ncbi:MAG: tetraacyldisaccharide 4'-kinase [Thermodesulfobacteriota bacterium]